MKKNKSVIIDASCILAIIKQEPSAMEVMDRLKGFRLYSSQCLPFEIGNALSKLMKRQLIDVTQACRFFELYKRIPIKLLEPDFVNSIRMAGEESHYCYDMYYLDCALKSGSPLFTMDERLAAIAKMRGVSCL